MDFDEDWKCLLYANINWSIMVLSLCICVCVIFNLFVCVCLHPFACVHIDDFENWKFI